MKKRLLSLLLCLVLLVGALPLSAAAEDPLFMMTNLKWDSTGTVASWDPVLGADHYVVSLYHTHDFSYGSIVSRYTVTNCRYDFSDDISSDETYYFIVSASVNGYYLGDIQGESSLNKLPVFTNLKWDANGSVASWDPIPHAKYYVVSLYRSQELTNGSIVSRHTVTDCKYDFSDDIASDETYYFIVTASVDGYDPSEILGQSPLNKHPVLTNLKWDSSGTVASWDPIPQASYYFVNIVDADSDGSDESIYKGRFTKVYDCQCDFSDDIDPKKSYYFVVYAILDGFGYNIDDITAKSGINKAPKLPTPTNLKWNEQGTEASWDYIPEADYYSVTLYLADGTKVVNVATPTEYTTYYTFSAPPGYITEGDSFYFTVVAVAEGYENSDAAQSGLNKVYPKLDKPANLRVDSTGTTAMWDVIPNAAEYSLTLYSDPDGNEVVGVNTSSCQFNLASYMETGKTYFFEVYGMASGYTNSDIATSAAITVSAADNSPLPAPTNLAWDATGSYATWDAVPDADTYWVGLFDPATDNVLYTYITTDCWCDLSSDLYPGRDYYFGVTAQAVDRHESTLAESSLLLASVDQGQGQTQGQTTSGVTLSPTLTGPMPFSDVAVDAWYYDSVYLAYIYELMNGMTATTFGPDGSVTLAQAVTMAVRAHHLYYGMAAVQMGSGDAWYLPFVQAAVQCGILTGREFLDFSRPATRAELAYIFAHVLPQDAYAVLNQVQSVSDVASTNPYASEILQMYRAGVLTGYSDGSFQPDKTVRRCEVAAIITRVILPTQRVRMY